MKCLIVQSLSLSTTQHLMIYLTQLIDNYMADHRIRISKETNDALSLLQLKGLNMPCFAAMQDEDERREQARPPVIIVDVAIRRTILFSYVELLFVPGQRRM